MVRARAAGIAEVVIAVVPGWASVAVLDAPGEDGAAPRYQEARRAPRAQQKAGRGEERVLDGQRCAPPGTHGKRYAPPRP